jgi:glyoxylase-like metal-dependent hydrolase (beta-lactamase superfamily II)
MKSQHQIFFTATAEIRFPATELGLILLHGGNHPTVPRERMLPSTFRDSVKWEDGSSGPGIAEPSPVWFISTGKEKIVIDSGLSEANVNVINKIFKSRGVTQYYVSLADQSVEKFLGGLGAKPEDIDIVILTHLHMDHFPNVGAYKKARILVHAKELVAAMAPNPYQQAHWHELRPLLVDVLDRVEVLHGDAKICDGVEVLEVGGHSPGQLAVLVQTSLGRVAIASDFFNTYQNIDYSWPPGVYTNLDEWESNCRRVKMAADVIVPGHDWAVWDRFPKGVIGDA